MARAKSLASMSIDALLKMRDEIGAVLSRKASDLRKELRAIGSDYADVGRIAIYGKKSMKARKIAPKYRDKHGNVWAGRGAQPLWLREAIKGGAKAEDFLIRKASRKKAAAKRAAKRTVRRAAKKTHRKRRAA